MINTTTTFKWYSGAKNKILDIGAVITEDIAMETLNRTYSSIPLAKTVNSGRLRLSSVSGGVREDSKGFYIGSYTSYAKYVWNMGENTNWSTPGTTGKWYQKVWKKEGNSILSSAIGRNKLK